MADDVGAVGFDDKFKLAGEKGAVAVVDGAGKEEAEFVVYAGFELVLAIINGLFDLDELDDGMDFWEVSGRNRYKGGWRSTSVGNDIIAGERRPP